MPYSVLVVSSAPAFPAKLGEIFSKTGENAFVLSACSQLMAGIERLRTESFQCVLVDLTQPGSAVHEALAALAASVPQVPVIVIGPADSEDVFKLALGWGAQDYLLENHLDRYALERAINGAVGRKALEDALYSEKERVRVTLNSIGDAVLSTDLAGNVTYMNPAAEKMTGWTRDMAIGRPATDVLYLSDAITHARVRIPLEIAIETNQTVGLSPNSMLLRRDGGEVAIEDSAAPIHDRYGHVAGAVTVFHDVSQSRAMTAKMSHLAQHDYLTDLPNRLLLADRISRAIAAASRHSRKLAILFVDLDHLKHINDSLGHSVGDLLLKGVATRLREAVRSSDTVSRQGGDEFVVLLPEIDVPEDAALIAEAMRAAVVLPYTIAGQELHISASIGISVYPNDGADAETLMKNADIAMYEAKGAGRNNYQFFSHDLTARAVERQTVEVSLRRALERGEFVLYYQPKVNLASGGITGAEALLRWQHPERGLLLPEDFLAVAEESGLMIPIGRWVMEVACRQAQQWIEEGLQFDQIAVNISTAEFLSKGFVERVGEVIHSTGLTCRCLELELTETALMANVESTLTVLKTLRQMGVRLAVDDFGTGYSSLSYLNQFPIDTLKIDQSFVRDFTRGPNNAALVSTIIAMGKNLNQRIIAEGVETDEQLRFLRAHDCPEGQGFLFGKPLVAAAFRRLLLTAHRETHHETHPSPPGATRKLGSLLSRDSEKTPKSAAPPGGAGSDDAAGPAESQHAASEDRQPLAHDAAPPRRT